MLVAAWIHPLVNCAMRVPDGNVVDGIKEDLEQVSILCGQAQRSRVRAAEMWEDSFHDCKALCCNVPDIDAVFIARRNVRDLQVLIFVQRHPASGEEPAEHISALEIGVVHFVIGPWQPVKVDLENFGFFDGLIAKQTFDRAI